ncbi:MAG: HAD family phosphatase [Burkholderiales bacterium]|nr:HAD family phosphatase [Burkholderiales bacterium]
MNVVFDFGGVLFDWKPHEFLTRLLPELTPTPEAARALAAVFFEGYGGDWAAFDRGTIEPDALALTIARRTGLAVHDTRKVIDGVPHELRPVAGAVALLRRLHAAGHGLYFLSNMPEVYAQHLQANHDFLSLFRDGVFSARVKLIKPEPEIYAHALAVFEIEAEHTLFIDDVAHNTDAARAAGWKAVHFQDPAQCERELVRHGLLPAAA